MSVTRRHFLMKLAATSGYTAACAAMTTLGLGAAGVAAGAEAAPLRLAPGSGKGQRVLVLGAGIAGLVAAWELRKAGYQVQVIEARQRVGGRNWTIRDGSRIEYTDGTVQTADFEPGQYFNAGPARLPSHHRTILGYCREFGVALEAEVNTSRSAYFLPDAAKGKPAIQLRRAVNDARGRLSELLAKAADGGALDRELSLDDRKRLLEFLKVYGDLTPELAFKGTERSGYTVFPGAAEQVGTRPDPLSLDDLLDPDLWTALVFDELLIFQPTMLQPVGGMDRIPAAFQQRLKKEIRLNTEVKAIHNGEQGVTVTVQDRATGKQQSLSADYAIATFPLPVLARVDANFSPAVRDAIASVEYDTASKIAWQAPRFWETDSNIYGGISVVKHVTGLVWYPSGGFHQTNGTLIGCYNISQAARDFTAQPLAAQFASSRDVIDRLHPGRGASLRRPVSVAWHKVPYSLGSWVHWGRPDAQQYVLLNQPDGRVHFAGEYLSQIGAWQEGAALSAHHAVAAIAARVAAASAS
ncbi:flavin monoamine oxidase family protein [Janthinobacterium agaricidamnosum]|uniref:Tryptophan 2-monooxygenase n=1 Tax=Janthinobacterium agaricidamnosum NBRC 102515 = DSM 9628 TaxID=1349767 RepID=W0V397_9BURK|nr:FAD-dependent oxidoreductase [Janthinobacterium agaricidamnosum]CDG82346.1 flavin containing amine oxidoreductase family protein [Janthinobacterium agaricidamnosum NBRC 102515 = DSM 9628]